MNNDIKTNKGEPIISEKELKEFGELINNFSTEELKALICDRIFKLLILYLYYNEDQYRDYLQETIETYNQLLSEYEGEIYSRNNKRFSIELNKKLELWLYYPDNEDNEQILYHIRGKIIFSELNQPRIYGLISKDNSLRLYPTEPWLDLAENIMDHKDNKNDEEKKKLGKEGWRSKYGKRTLKSLQEEQKIIEEKNLQNNMEEMKSTNNNDKNFSITNTNTNLEELKETSVLSKDEIIKMKLPELKIESKKRGLSIYGKKNELQKNLLEFYKLE